MNSNLANLRAEAQRKKIRITRRVNGKRVYLSASELRNAIQKVKTRRPPCKPRPRKFNYDSAMENNVRANANISRDAARVIKNLSKNKNTNNEFFDAENTLNNVFFNANNSPFELRRNAENSIAMHFKTKLANDALVAHGNVTKRLPGVRWEKLKTSAVRLAQKIKGMVASGNFVKAVATLGALMQVVYIHQNPRMYNNMINASMGRVPLVRAVFRKGNGLFARSLSAFGASPTEAQAIYEAVMGTIPENAYNRSLAGVFLSYLSMVTLSLVSMLPWKQTRGISFAVLQFMFRQIERAFPSVAKVVFKVLVERKATSTNRAKRVVAGAATLTKSVLPLILRAAF